VLLAHVQHFHQGGDDEFAVKRKRLALLSPGFPLFCFKDAAELLRFAELVDVLLQHGHLQVFAKKAKVRVEHLRKDPEHSSLILVDRTFNVDVEQNRFGLAAGGAVDQHKGGGVVCEFLAELLYGGNSSDGLILKNIGQHFQEVRFTASKKAGDPHADVGCRLVKSITVIVKEGNKMLFQLLGDNIFPHFLLNYIRCILINLDNSIDFP